MEAVAKVAGLLALTLPLVGIGVRLVAFQLGGIPNALQLASREPVAALATTAFSATWPSVLLVTAFALAVNRRWIPAATSQRDLEIAQAHPRYWKWRVRFDRAFVALTLVALSLVMPWPGGILTAFAGVGMGMAIGWLDIRKRLTIYTAALVVTAMGCANALAAGLEGSGVGNEVGMYHFTSTAGVPADGRYIRLGGADGMIYLQSCAAGHQVIGVNIQDVREFSGVTPSDSQTPNLVGIVFSHRTPEIGYSPHC